MRTEGRPVTKTHVSAAFLIGVSNWGCNISQPFALAGSQSVIQSVSQAVERVNECRWQALDSDFVIQFLFATHEQPCLPQIALARVIA